MKFYQTKIFVALITVVCVFGLLLVFVSKPVFKKVDSFKISELNEGVLKANSKFIIENPNWFSINGKNLTVDLYFHKHHFAKGSTSNFNLRKRAESIIDLNIDFYLDSLESEMKSILLQDSILITAQMKGTFSFLQLKGEKEQQMWLKTKDILEPLVKSTMSSKGMNVKSIKLVEFNVKQTILEVELEFKNKLPITLTLKNIQFSVLSEKDDFLSIADWNFDINKNIKPKQTESIKGIAKVDNFNTAFSGLEKLMKGKTDGYLTGFATIALNGREIKIPISQHFEMDILTREITILKD
jgi:LEA14-like dessication related protein